MTMTKPYRVTQSVDNLEGNRCVDVIELSNGQFRFQEWRREPEDLSVWFLMVDSLPVTFASEEEAMAAARQAIVWLKAASKD